MGRQLKPLDARVDEELHELKLRCCRKVSGGLDREGVEEYSQRVRELVREGFYVYEHDRRARRYSGNFHT